MNRGYVYAALREHESANASDRLHHLRGGESLSLKTRNLCLERSA